MFIPSASWYTSVSPLQVDSSNQIKRSSQKQHKIWWPYIRHVISGNNFRRYCNPTAMMTISIEHLLHQLRSSKSLPILWISKKTFQRFPKIAPRLNPELFQQASWISSWWFQLKNISQTGSIPQNNWAKNEKYLKLETTTQFSTSQVSIFLQLHLQLLRWYSAPRPTYEAAPSSHEAWAKQLQVILLTSDLQGKAPLRIP